MKRFLVFILPIALLLFGGRAFAMKVVVIDGARLWQDTGITVTAGQRLRITATGNIFYKEEHPVIGPMGYPNPTFDRLSLLPDARILALVGHVDGVPVPGGAPGQEAGFIGPDYMQTIPASGRLHLAFNDSFFSDNEGAFTASIDTVPLPAPVLVMGSALLALITVSGRKREISGDLARWRSGTGIN